MSHLLETSKDGWLLAFLFIDIKTYIWSCCSHGLAREEISNLKAQYKASGFYENKEDISVSETFHGSCLGLISIVTAAVKTTRIFLSIWFHIARFVSLKKKGF